MGFLKKSNVPSELPDLAMDSLGANASRTIEPPIAKPAPISQFVEPQVSAPVPVKNINIAPNLKKEVAGEDYLTPRDDSNDPDFLNNQTFQKPIHENVKELINEDISHSNDSDKNGGFPKSSFFDDVLEDINGGIADVGKLEDWYEKKFVKEDVVSNMKGYWEGNKADIIIQSFGAEYKRQINDKVRALRELEEDWREIYFRLIKKEEEMKKEERELKETVSEFVSLCKRRKQGDKKNGEK